MTSPTDRCIVCASAELDAPVEINDGWQMRVCRGCEAGTTWPRPTEKQVVENNVETYPLDVRVAIYSSRGAEFRARADQLLKFLPIWPASILDFGCDLGLFLSHARYRGVERVAGVEINEASRLWAGSSQQLDVRRTMSEFGDERFDVITFQDALEHVSDPLRLLEECVGRLNGGGAVFIQLPNRSSKMVRDAGPNWTWYSAPDHLMHLTPESIRVLAREAGLRVHSLRTVDAIVDVWLQRGKRIPSRVITPLRRVPALQGLRVRHGNEGGLIQAVLTPIQQPDDIAERPRQS